MDENQLKKLFEDNYGRLPAGHFDERTTMLLQAAYDAGYAVGTRDAEYDAQMAENSRW